jgi:midasin
MRTASDRTHVVSLYREIFGESSLAAPPTPPFYHITDNMMQVGYSAISRQTQRPIELTAPNSESVELRLLPKMLQPLSHLTKCVEMGWMCILSGPAASGKTSLVRLLAQLAGRTLHEFAMNSSVDTTEILGKFHLFSNHK